MATPYDRKILLVHWIAAKLATPTIEAFAQRIKTKMPNVAGVMVKVINGKQWLERGNSADPKAITGITRIGDWVTAFDKHGLEVHVWGVPKGRDAAYVNEEAQLYASAAKIEGVKSVLLDVEYGESYWQGDAALGRRLMEAIRTEAPAGTHIGLILDGRRNRPFSVFVDPFIPYIDSLHPMVYPLLFGTYQSINAHLDEALRNLAPYNKPIVPMLQSFQEVTRRPTPAEITEQGHLSFSKGGVGISFFRVGDDNARDGHPHMGAPEQAAIAAIERPPDPRKKEPPLPTYTWQDMINAMVTVGARHDATWQNWFDEAGLGQVWNESLRNQPYSGPATTTWTTVDAAYRAEIEQLLTLSSLELARVTAEAQTEAEARRTKQSQQRRSERGSILGIHGVPGTVAPPLNMWDTWIDLLKRMGITWYKQLDDGNPDDTGDGSVFRWAMRLQQEGITPIIRYYVDRQFPGTLPAHFFDKMKKYAQEGIVYAEIGNEPNLDREWQADWQPRPGPGGFPMVQVTHTNPSVIQRIAQCWITDAAAAVKAGARPAFYAFAPTDWRGNFHPHYSSVFFTQKVIQALAMAHRQQVVNLFNQGAWIAVHAATYEQPFDLDPFGQGGVVWDMTLRSYEVVVKAFKDYFGGDLNLDAIDIISTEGGVFTPESNSMSGHDRLRSNDEHAERTIGMFKWLESHSPLRAMCPWCLSVGPLIGYYNEEFKFDGWVEEINAQLSPRPVVREMRGLVMEHERAESDKVLLDVPYISQWDLSAKSHIADCGPTCMAMILNAPPGSHTYTVDELYQQPPLQNKTQKAMTLLWEMLQIGASELHSKEEYSSRDKGIARIKELVQAGTPVVPLVNYAKWDDVAKNNYKNGHFVVVTGYDDQYIYVHDPLFWGERRSEGRYFAWKYERFLDGWGSGSDIGNPNFWMLVPDKKVPHVEE